jgi:hypothetical protein
MLARCQGLAPGIVDAITGHRRNTVADGYGEFPVDALLREAQEGSLAVARMSAKIRHQELSALRQSRSTSLAT